VNTFLQGFNDVGLSEIHYNAGGGPGVMLVQATQENGVRRSTNSEFLLQFEREKI
jgi:hypothetical protein